MSYFVQVKLTFFNIIYPKKLKVGPPATNWHTLHKLLVNNNKDSFKSENVILCNMFI